MNCKQCLSQYSTSKPTIPRVLINCGHTLCQSCIQKSFQTRHLSCPQCTQISYGISFHQYPINATLIALLKQQAVCKVHNLKLDAYCQKDNQLLCLSCVIGNTHKGHKIYSITEKVGKDRAILKECMNQILQSCAEIQTVSGNTQENIDKLEGEYKDYLLQIGLCFNNIRQTIKQIQQNCLSKAKTQYQSILEKHYKVLSQMKQKSEFMNQLSKMYQQVICLPNLQYLNQDNKRLFIMENCKFKKNCKIDIGKLGFNKLSALNQTVNAVQQMISYEKKLQGQCTPALKSKRSTKNKQPTILQVNLNQQYKKHFKSDPPIHPSSQSPSLQNPSLKPQKQVNSTKPSSTPKQDKNVKKQAISISGGDHQQSHHQNHIHIHNNIHNSNGHNSSFHSQCMPISMINSFMESSQNNISMSIRGSDADFTIFAYDHKIYHFGGFNDSTVQYSKIDDPKTMKIITNASIQRCKSQCAIIPAYGQNKCLIFGGKSIINDQKLDSIIQYDLQNHKWGNTLFKLSQGKSGFGSVIKQNKLYIAGGSNSTRSLKSFQQYKITPLNMLKSDLPSLHHCRDELGLTLGFDGNIYACGGINQSGSVLSSCERYNQSKGRWEIIASMNKARRSFCLVSLPHGLYAIGGYDGVDYLADVELYDFAVGKWIVVKSMNQPRFAHTAVVTSDLQNIIVSGGFYKKPLKSMEIFDVIKEQWKTGNPLQTERFLHCSLISNF